MRRLLGIAAMGIAIWNPVASTAAEDAGWREGWHFQLTPYLWMASLEGDAAVISGLPTVKVDASFDDILDRTDLAVALQAEARRDRLGFVVDLFYLGLSADAYTRGRIFSKVDLEASSFFGTAAGFYRLVDRERGAFDLFAGARLWNVDTELEFAPGTGFLARGRKIDDEETWVDPVIGARGSLQLIGPFSLSAGADIGGFGAASDLTWQMVGTVDFAPWDWLVIRAGYRHLDVDYDHGGFVWDVALSGPIIGASLRF